MSSRRHSTQQIIHKLRESEVLIAQSQTVEHACKQIGVTVQTYYRWRKEYAGLKTDQAKRLKELEQVACRGLRRPVAEVDDQ